MTQGIPGFIEHGLLPVGVHPCSVDDVQVVLVDGFPESETRPSLLNLFRDFCEQASGVGLHATQWVDGSFVENRLNPADVDVLNWVDGVVYNALNPTVHTFMNNVLSGNFAHTKWKTDSRWLPVIPEGHPQHAVYVDWLAYWHEQWGTTREVPRPGDAPPNTPKGFLELRLGDSSQTPSVSGRG